MMWKEHQVKKDLTSSLKKRYGQKGHYVSGCKVENPGVTCYNGGKVGHIVKNFGSVSRDSMGGSASKGLTSSTPKEKANILTDASSRKERWNIIKIIEELAEEWEKLEIKVQVSGEYFIYVLRMPKRFFRGSQGRVPVPSVSGSSEDDLDKGNTDHNDVDDNVFHPITTHYSFESLAVNADYPVGVITPNKKRKNSISPQNLRFSNALTNGPSGSSPKKGTNADDDGFIKVSTTKKSLRLTGKLAPLRRLNEVCLMERKGAQ
ncbi:hypothetical protein AgCh_035867 [Apium graveolens]